MTHPKGEHVKRARQTRTHGCHWPGCPLQVPPAKWGCTKHWFMLPKWIRDEIWAAYVIGQEQALTPSRAYLNIARAAQDWIKEVYFDVPPSPQA